MRKINQNCLYLNFFSSLWIQFFSPYLSSYGVRNEKLLCYFENTSTGTCRSVIPRLREHQKAQLLLNFLNVATHFCPIKHSSIFHSGSILLETKVFLENGWFCVLRHNSHSLKILKNVFFLYILLPKLSFLSKCKFQFKNQKPE